MNQEEFYQKISEWISQEKTRWNHITLMAYFCHKYEEKNGVRFRLVRWKEDPGKGKESKDFAKVIKIFLPEDFDKLPKDKKEALKKASIIKTYNYINWMFDYKFRSGDKSVTGTQIFLLPSMINEFERMYSRFLSNKKEVSKISELIQWAKENIPDIFKLHQVEEIRDIQMIEKYIHMYKLSDNTDEFKLLTRAKEMEIV